MILAEGMGNVGFIVLIVGMMVLMMVMTIIPQRKQKKKMAAMMSSIKVDDMIMTIGGFIGKIVSVDEEKGRYTINVGTEENPTIAVVIKSAVRSKIDN